MRQCALTNAPRRALRSLLAVGLRIAAVPPSETCSRSMMARPGVASDSARSTAERRRISSSRWYDERTEAIVRA